MRDRLTSSRQHLPQMWKLGRSKGNRTSLEPLGYLNLWHLLTRKEVSAYCAEAWRSAAAWWDWGFSAQIEGEAHVSLKDPWGPTGQVRASLWQVQQRLPSGSPRPGRGDWVNWQLNHRITNTDRKPQAVFSVTPRCQDSGGKRRNILDRDYIALEVLEMRPVCIYFKEKLTVFSAPSAYEFLVRQI